MAPKQLFRAYANGRWLECWRCVLVGVFGYGTAVHVVQLAVSGGRPYQGNPWWLVIFFVSLTVFDPAVAVGLARRRRWAVWSAVAAGCLRISVCPDSAQWPEEHRPDHRRPTSRR